MNGGGIIIITGKKPDGSTQQAGTMTVANAQSAHDWITAQNPPTGSAEAALAAILQDAINYASG